MREFGWLEHLTSDEVSGIQPLGHCADIRPGVVIFSPTRSPESVFLLRRGLVRIHRLSRGGDEVTLGFVGPREVFGEMTSLGDFPRESYAITVTDCRVCEIPQKTFRNLMGDHPELLHDVATLIGRRLKRIESRVESLVFHNVFLRVCLVLSELAEDFGRQEAAGVVIDVPLTQAELAALIGAVRQTVSASLHRLEERGLIGRQGRRFVLFDPDGIRRLIESGSSI